ncbi:MAG: hypothetical protein AAB706_04030 [Patescibacteria group bacterium]
MLDLYTYKDTRSLEELGDKRRLVLATILPYKGKSSSDVVSAFGKPTEIKHEVGSLPINRGGQEKIQFDETWEYFFCRGNPLIHQECSIMKIFYFKEGKVVEVDAF